MFLWIVLFDQESTEYHCLGEVGRDKQNALPLRSNFSSIVPLRRSFDVDRTKKPRWVLNAEDEEQSFLIEGRVCKVKDLHSSRPLQVSFAQAANHEHLQKLVNWWKSAIQAAAFNIQMDGDKWGPA